MTDEPDFLIKAIEVEVETFLAEYSNLLYAAICRQVIRKDYLP